MTDRFRRILRFERFETEKVLHREFELRFAIFAVMPDLAVTSIE